MAAAKPEKPTHQHTWHIDLKDTIVTGLAALSVCSLASQARPVATGHVEEVAEVEETVGPTHVPAIIQVDHNNFSAEHHAYTQVPAISQVDHNNFSAEHHAYAQVLLDQFSELHAANQSATKAASILQFLPTPQTLPIEICLVELMRLIAKFAEKVCNNLVDTAAQDTANAITTIIRRLLHSSESNNKEPESGITVENADQQLSPDARRAITELKQELLRRAQSNPDVPLDKTTIDAFQTTKEGTYEALRSWLSPAQAAAVADYIRQRTADDSLADFPAATHARALHKIGTTGATLIDRYNDFDYDGHFT